MAKLNNTSTVNVLRACWFTPGYEGRWGLPLLLIGDPGTGKTSGLTANARALGLRSKVLIGSISDPTDFGGIPSTPLDGGAFSRSLLPGWLRDVDDWGNASGVLVLDELTCVPAAQQAAMLRLVLEGCVGDYRLPAGVRIVAAANPVEQAAGGQPLALPMVNRFGHLEVEPAALDDWFSILAGEFYSEAPVDAAALEAQVTAAWPAAYARAQALAQGFLRKRPECSQRTPRVGTPEAEQAWTSRRSWEFAMRALAGASIHGLTVDERDTLLAAFLGEATAIEFAGWLRDADLPDEVALLDGKVQWQPVIYRPDRTATVLGLCAAAVLKTADEQTRVARARVLWNLLAEVARDTPDLAQPCCVRLARDPKLLTLPEALAAQRQTVELARAIGMGGLKR